MKRYGFSMIELVFVIVILGALATVAVPRFVATRIDSEVATLRLDAASLQKAIVAKVFADYIDTTYSVAPVPYMKAVDAIEEGKTIDWSEWMLDIGGLDRTRWAPATFQPKRGVSPLSNWRGGIAMPCGSQAFIEIQPNGDLYFNPAGLVSPLSSGNDNDNLLCRKLKESYKLPDGTYDNRTIPLATTRVLDF